MELVRPLSLFAAMTVACAGLSWAGVAPTQKSVEARIQAPQFPDRDFAITSYGAKPGADCTDAIQAAIEACHAAGGGRVLVPAGGWLTGAIRLKSNVNLHVAEGATLRWTFELAKYPVVFTRWEGVECMNYSPFLYAFDQENIAITGKGTLDGGSDESTWWDWNKKSDRVKKQKADRDKLFKMGEDNVVVAQRVFGDGYHLRPNFIQPYKCRNILIEGVTMVRSPMWLVHPVLSRNITVRGLKIVSHGPNNDGCDPESCTDVLIEDTLFDTGDDCIAIKSGRNGDGRRVNVPTENVIVRNVQMDDITSTASPRVMFIRGFENAVIDDIRISNSNFKGVTDTEVIAHAGSISLRNVTIEPAKNTRGLNSN